MSIEQFNHPKDRQLRIYDMEFDITAYKQRTAPLAWKDLDLDFFSKNPLDEHTLRCLRYMHDVEFHTVCYLRDLLVGPAHSDPEVTTFLSCWVYEELWHGEALADVLAFHGEAAGTSRVSPMRRRLQLSERFRPISMILGGALAGEDLVAVQMAWGAINEWTTQAGYAQLAKKAKNPVLTELLKRIMRQEGRHIDFYASQAQRRLGRSRRSRLLARLALSRLWAPVGSGVMPTEETAFMAQHLMADEEGMTVARRIDRRIDRLPGLANLGLLENSILALR